MKRDVYLHQRMAAYDFRTYSRADIISSWEDDSYLGVAADATGGCFFVAILHSEIVYTATINVPITITYIILIEFSKKSANISNMPDNMIVIDAGIKK
jgi:hypothetical protein